MMAQFTAEIDAMGRVTIAPEVLNSLRLSPGTTLVVKVKDDDIILQPIPEEPELIEKDGLLVVRTRAAGNISNWVERDRKERVLSLVKEFE